MSVDRAKDIRRRLEAHCKSEKGYVDMQRLLIRFGMECFFRRLAVSTIRSDFVLKGAMLREVPASASSPFPMWNSYLRTKLHFRIQRRFQQAVFRHSSRYSSRVSFFSPRVHVEYTLRLPDMLNTRGTIRARLGHGEKGELSFRVVERCTMALKSSADKTLETLIDYRM